LKFQHSIEHFCIIKQSNKQFGRPFCLKISSEM
jgi:hypothetical protein